MVKAQGQTVDICTLVTVTVPTDPVDREVDTTPDREMVTTPGIMSVGPRRCCRIKSQSRILV